MAFNYFRYGSYIGSTVGEKSKAGVFHLRTSQVIGDALFAFTSFTFTDGGTPNWEANAGSVYTSAYAGASFLPVSSSGNFNVVSGVQLLAIPKNGTYRIKVAGGSGGTPTYTGTNWSGRGVIYQADFDLNKSDIIRIVVGSRGGNFQYTAGGGGASHVAMEQTMSSNTVETEPLIMAGGGGGGGNSGGTGYDAVYTNNGIAGRYSGSSFGTNGGGGLGGGGWGTGGAGWVDHGTGSGGGHANWGGSDENHRQDGTLGTFVGTNQSHGTGYSSNLFDYSSSGSCYGAAGGFGGGGAGQCNGGGGGAGYSGGGAGGGGGGSYVSSSGSSVTQVGYNTTSTSGYVEITVL